jgi:hypothetical protein
MYTQCYNSDTFVHVCLIIWKRVKQKETRAGYEICLIYVSKFCSKCYLVL